MDRKKKLETSLEGLFSRPSETQSEAKATPAAAGAPKKSPEKTPLKEEKNVKTTAKTGPKDPAKQPETKVGKNEIEKPEQVKVEKPVPPASPAGKPETIGENPQKAAPKAASGPSQTNTTIPTPQPQASQPAAEKIAAEAPQPVEQELATVQEDEIVFQGEIEEDDTQLLVFEINQVNYGIEVGQVQTIIKPQPVYLVPGTADYLKGLTNLRGEVVPVIDLRTRFDLPEKEIDKDTRFMVIKVNDIMASLVVDKVNGVKTISTSLIEKPSGVVLDINNRYLTGMARLDDMIVLILDLVQTINPKMSEIR